MPDRSPRGMDLLLETIEGKKQIGVFVEADVIAPTANWDLGDIASSHRRERFDRFISRLTIVVQILGHLASSNRVRHAYRSQSERTTGEAASCLPHFRL